MGRNKQTIVRRWTPRTPGQSYSKDWITSQFRDLRVVLDDWADMLDNGPIPGQTISYDFGLDSYDNSGGGATAIVRPRVLTEGIFEPVFFAVGANTITGSALTVFLRHSAGGTDILTSSVTLNTGTDQHVFRAAASDFAVVEIPRQTWVNLRVEIPVGATVVSLGARLVGRRLGRIADVGTTGTLGR